MIKITVNGDEQEIKGEVSIQDFLMLAHPSGSMGIAVALNGEILLREHYPQKQLNEGDSLELVQMTAGG